jgi:hypothetical protein
VLSQATCITIKDDGLGGHFHNVVNGSFGSD